MAVRIDLVRDVQDLISKATGGVIPAAPPPDGGGAGGGAVVSPIPGLPQTTVPVVVTKTVDRPVGWREKIKGSYKAIVSFIGAVLVLATQIQAWTPFLPAQYREAIGAGVAVLTAISTFLVRNQTWIDGL